MKDGHRVITPIFRFQSNSNNITTLQQSTPSKSEEAQINKFLHLPGKEGRKEGISAFSFTPT